MTVAVELMGASPMIEMCSVPGLLGSYKAL
jgi:hypothetical protein